MFSNFIESDYVLEFKLLKSYVKNSNILTSVIHQWVYGEDSHFQHISFSDYHMFSIGKAGIEPEYIEALFEKIISKEQLQSLLSFHFEVFDSPVFKGS